MLHIFALNSVITTHFSVISILYFNRISDKLQQLIRKEGKQYKKSYKNLNSF